MDMHGLSVARIWACHASGAPHRVRGRPALAAPTCIPSAPLRGGLQGSARAIKPLQASSRAYEHARLQGQRSCGGGARDGACAQAARCALWMSCNHQAAGTPRSSALRSPSLPHYQSSLPAMPVYNGSMARRKPVAAVCWRPPHDNATVMPAVNWRHQPSCCSGTQGGHVDAAAHETPPIREGRAGSQPAAPRCRWSRSSRYSPGEARSRVATAGSSTSHSWVRPLQQVRGQTNGC